MLRARDYMERDIDFNENDEVDTNDNSIKGDNQDGKTQKPET